jgi:hypothetical protein
VRSQIWNDYRVITRENRLLQEINRVVTVDVIDREQNARRGRFGAPIACGTPMLIQFKDIGLKTLNERD